MMANLFRLLPPELKSEIFQFDNTYHSVFKQPNFKHELSFKQFFLTNPQEFDYQFDAQLETIIDVIFYDFDEGRWRNEYGVISSNFYEEITDYDYLQNGYKCKFFPQKDDTIKFKILPHNKEIEEHFMNSTNKKYDGFVCSSQKHVLFKHKIIPKPMTDTFCQYDDILTDFNLIIYLSYSLSY